MRTPLFAVKPFFGYGKDGGYTGFRIYDSNAPSHSVVESVTHWATREEAQAAAERVNAGDESGIEFASYADD